MTQAHLSKVEIDTEISTIVFLDWLWDLGIIVAMCWGKLRLRQENNKEYITKTVYLVNKIKCKHKVIHGEKSGKPVLLLQTVKEEVTHILCLIGYLNRLENWHPEKPYWVLRVGCFWFLLNTYQI